jgi:hypothetical protein
MLAGEGDVTIPISFSDVGWQIITFTLKKQKAARNAAPYRASACPTTPSPVAVATAGAAHAGAITELREVCVEAPERRNADKVGAPAAAATAGATGASALPPPRDRRRRTI